jgi:predicted ATP-dependent endonuclease of OLD family
VFGPRAPLTTSAARQLAADAKARAAILAEGWSDQAAVETLEQRRGCDLLAEGIIVVPIGGVTNLGHFIDALGARGLGLALTGLYDAGEERHVFVASSAAAWAAASRAWLRKRWASSFATPISKTS